MGSMTTHMDCPHCAGRITVRLAVGEGPEKKPMGPTPYNPGLEVDSLAIEAIEVWRTSFRSLAELLEQRGVPTAKGGNRWYAASARSLYNNAVKRRDARDAAAQKK